MKLYTKVRKAVFEAIGIKDNGESCSVSLYLETGTKEGRKFFKENASKGDELHSCSAFIYLTFKNPIKNASFDKLSVFTKMGVK